MFLNINKILPFIAFIISYSFGTYIFLREPNRVINRLFVLIIITPFVDDFLRLMYWLKILDYEILSEIPDCTLFVILPFYFHFIESFEERPLSWFKTVFLYLFSVLFLFLIFYRQNQLLSFFYLAAFFLLLAAQAGQVLKNYRLLEKKDIGYHYKKVQHILIYTGFTLNAAFVSLIDFIIEPQYRDQFQMLSTLIIVVFISIALLRVRLANVFYILKKSTIYALFLFVFIFSYIATAVYLFNYFQIISNIYAAYYMALFFVIFAIIFRPIVDFIRTFIDLHIFGRISNYRRIIEEFSQKISSIYQFGELISLIAGIFTETFKPGFLCFIQHNIIEGFSNESINMKNVELNAVFEYVKTSSYLKNEFDKNGYVFVNYILDDKKMPLFFREFLNNGSICLLIPIYSENDIFGFFALGYKFTKDSFNDDDLQLITTIMNQACVALKNIEIHKHLVESNKQLEKTINELKSAQQELARKEKLAALGRLAATIAHEVKNPLGIMKVSASTIANALDEKSKLREMAFFINKEIDRLNDTVSELLDFARDRELNKSNGDLRNFISDIIKKGDLYARSENKKIEFQFNDYAEESQALIMELDIEQLSRAFLNIIINSADAVSREKNGIITISIRLDENTPSFILIEIADNGSGIAGENLAKLFEPFFSTKKKGTGLGLGIARQIIEKHGGSISIESQKDSGTTVKIILPYIEQPNK
ncbi:MAG: ATP-binding protein [Candidatus Wallbacteria bacterium]